MAQNPRTYPGVLQLLIVINILRLPHPRGQLLCHLNENRLYVKRVRVALKCNMEKRKGKAGKGNKKNRFRVSKVWALGRINSDPLGACVLVRVVQREDRKHQN